MTTLQIFGISTHDAAAAIALLTQRERDVIACVAMGMRNKEIGRKLGMAHKTVDVHTNNIRIKCGVDRNSLPRIWFASMFHKENHDVLSAT